MSNANPGSHPQLLIRGFSSPPPMMLHLGKWPWNLKKFRGLSSVGLRTWKNSELLPYRRAVGKASSEAVIYALELGASYRTSYKNNALLLYTEAELSCMFGDLETFQALSLYGGRERSDMKHDLHFLLVKSVICESHERGESVSNFFLNFIWTTFCFFFFLFKFSNYSIFLFYLFLWLNYLILTRCNILVLMGNIMISSIERHIISINARFYLIIEHQK